MKKQPMLSKENCQYLQKAWRAIAQDHFKELTKKPCSLETIKKMSSKALDSPVP